KTDHVPNPYRDDAYEPTCRMEGYTGDLYCSDCGELIEEGKPISKTDHIPNDYRVGAQEPTCWEEGYTGDLYCRECGEIIEWSETIPQIFHEDKDGNGLCDYCSEILDVYFYAEGCAMEFDKAPLMHVYMMFTDEVLNADDSCVRFWLGEDKDKAQEFKLSETPTRDINVSGVGSFRCYDFVVRVPLKDLYTEMHGTLCFDGRELDCLTTTASEYLEAVRDAFPNLNYMVDALLSASRCSAAYFGVSSEDVSWVLNILEEQYDDVTEELAQYYNDDQRSEYAGTSLVLKEELKLRNYYTEKMALKNYTASGEKDGLFYYEYEISYSDLKMDCDGHSALEYIYKALKFSDDEYMKAVAFSLYDMYLKFNW
ncbi:MAG: hypothetical protein MJ071_10005, partial [Oscillospiraceae bacterium]|nr:hypothetical protein [Oscillospiraceae bacterium]